MTNYKKNFRKNPKKLLYLSQSLGMGGAETFLTDLLVELQKLGWLVTSGVAHYPFKKHLQKNKIDSFNIPIIVDVVGDWKGFLKGIFLMPFAFLIYFKIIYKNRDADIVLASSFSEKIFASIACKVLKKPIIWIEFASIEPLLSKFWGFPGLFYKIVLRIPEKIITSSEHSRKKLLSELDLSPERIAVIPCGINLPKIPAAQHNTKTPTIVCVSRLQPGKGQDLLIRALPKIINEFPNVKLRIVGTGDFATKLKKLVKDLSLEKNVVFVGFVPDVYVEYQNSQVSVFPTVWALEGFGMIAIESMAIGAPVVAYDFGPIPEIIDDGKNGLLAEAGSTSDLAEKIILLLKNKSLRHKLSANARKKIEKCFTIRYVASKYQSMFEEILSNGS